MVPSLHQAILSSSRRFEHEGLAGEIGHNANRSAVVVASSCRFVGSTADTGREGGRQRCSAERGTAR